MFMKGQPTTIALRMFMKRQPRYHSPTKVKIELKARYRSGSPTKVKIELKACYHSPTKVKE